MMTEAEEQYALSYDGYERISSDLAGVLAPAMTEYRETGRVPHWCGIDFLRAWAFYRQREYRWDGTGEVAPDFSAVLEAIRRDPRARLDDLPPARPEGLPSDWAMRLRDTMAEPYWHGLMAFVAAERDAHDIYPAENLTFRAFDLTPIDKVRVVILGQDPYPTPGDADGLAFSSTALATPMTLRNIFDEMAADVGPRSSETNSLTGWARQGVLLLNTALTFRGGSQQDPNEHRAWRCNKKQGWHTFTDAVIKAVSESEQPVVFILWGSDARKKKKRGLIADRHCVIESWHPSGRSVSGFRNTKPFSRANEFLRAARGEEIDWQQTA